VSGDDAGAGQESPVGHGQAARAAQANARRAGRHDNSVRDLGHGGGPSPTAGQAVHHSAVRDLRRAARDQVEAQATGLELLGRGGGTSEVGFAGVRRRLAFVGQRRRRRRRVGPDREPQHRRRRFGRVVAATVGRP